MTGRAGAGSGRPLSIALVHYAADPVVGGVERVLRGQAVVLADAGHDVRIVAGRGASPDARVRYVGIPLLDPRHPMIERLQGDLDAGRVPPDFPAAVAELDAALSAALAGVDVVIAHNVCSLNLNLPLTAALRAVADRGAPPRLILWHHDLAATSADYRPTLHDGPPWDLLREAWPGVVQVVVSEKRRRELADLTGLPPESISVVPNGIDVASAWKLEPETAGLLARTDLLGMAPLLLVAARMTPRKNVELALRVVAAMRAAGRPAGLLVTGPGDPYRPGERDYVERVLGLRHSLGLDGVAWFLATELGGPPSDAVVGDLYRLVDALFVPSRDEGFGLPVLEAALHRLPIACTDLSALRETAGDAALYFVPDEDPAAIAARVLERLDSDPVARLAMRVRSEHSWQAIYRTRIAPLLGVAAGAAGS